MTENPEDSYEEGLKLLRQSRSHSDIKEGLELFKLSAEQDYGPAHYLLAVVYNKGEKVAQDFDLSFYHLSYLVK